jgi:hypothetical protein
MPGPVVVKTTTFIRLGDHPSEAPTDLAASGTANRDIKAAFIGHAQTSVGTSATTETTSARPEEPGIGDPLPATDGTESARRNLQTASPASRRWPNSLR